MIQELFRNYSSIGNHWELLRVIGSGAFNMGLYTSQMKIHEKIIALKMEKKKDNPILKEKIKVLNEKIKRSKLLN